MNLAISDRDTFVPKKGDLFEVNVINVAAHSMKKRHGCVIEVDSEWEDSVGYGDTQYSSRTFRVFLAGIGTLPFYVALYEVEGEFNEDGTPEVGWEWGRAENDDGSLYDEFRPFTAKGITFSIPTSPVLQEAK